MGHTMVPVPPGCPLQGLAHTVGLTLGVPSDRVCLTTDQRDPYLETDEDVGASPNIWATLLVPFNDSPHGHHVRGVRRNNTRLMYQHESAPPRRKYSLLPLLHVGTNSRLRMCMDPFRGGRRVRILVFPPF